MGKELAEEIEDIPNISITAVDNKIVINTNAALAPRVVIGALSNDSLSCRAGQTATATFTVSGRRLTDAITAALSDSTHFSISDDSLTPSSGVVETETLTVTYTPGSGETAGTSHSLRITIESDGVTYGTLELTGTVAAAPSITLTPASLSIAAESGQQGEGVINVKGTALDADITLTLSNASYMSFEAGSIVTTKTIAKASAEASAGVDVTIYYTGTASDSGTITASSTGATNATASVSASIIQREDAGTTFDISNLRYTVLSNNRYVSVKMISTALSGAVTVPSSVTHNGADYIVSEVAQDGFKGAQITSISLPDSVKKLKGGGNFYGCSSLTSIDLGNGLEEIEGNTTFFGNTALTSIILPDSFKIGGSATFQSCTRLTTIQFGKTTAFAPTALNGTLTWAGSSTSDEVANNLTTIICYAETPPTLASSNYLPKGISGTTLKVPAGSVSDYQGDSKWSGFSNIIAIS